MHNNTAFQQISIFTGILALAMLSCSSVADVSGLFATETPTPTNTFTPSPTLTPSPTVTPTETPSPTATPRPSGVMAEEQPDGTTLFTDYDNQYQLILPPKWEIVFSSQKEIQQALESAGSQDPQLSEMAKSFKGENPDIFRLAAMNVDRYYLQSGFPILLTINAIGDTIASSMPMEFVTAMIEDSVLQEATSTTWEVTASESGVEVGLVEGSRAFEIPNGPTVNTRELVIAFQSNQKLILIEIIVPEEYQEEIFSSFDNTADSIKINPE